MRRKKKNKPESLSVRIKDVRNHSFVEPISIPKYESDGAVGFDFVCHGNTHINDVHGTVIEAGRMKLIPTGVIVEVPKGYMLMVVPRSSTARKYNLMMPNSVGIIDNDYCGEDDEILIPVYNFGEHDVFVKTGDKIAQGVIVKIATADFVEVDSMAEESRGGFGSTDKKTESES